MTPPHADLAISPTTLLAASGPRLPVFLKETMHRHAGKAPVALLGVVALSVSLGGWHQGGLATLLPMIAILVASFAASMAGFAFSAICGALLFQLMDDPRHVVQVMMLCSLANQALATWSVRHAIRAALILPFLLGGLIGVPLGVYLLLHLRSALLLELLGGLMIVLALQQYLSKAKVRAETHRAIDLVCGVMAGVIGGFSGSPGAVIAVRSGMKPWEKLTRRGVLQPAILVLQVIALVLISLMGPSGAPSVLSLANLAFIPVSLLGTCAGLAVFHRMTDRQFTHALNAALMASGLALLA